MIPRSSLRLFGGGNTGRTYIFSVFLRNSRLGALSANSIPTTEPISQFGDLITFNLDSILFSFFVNLEFKPILYRKEEIEFIPI
ncbi:hypothetical protein RBB68_00770 [Leptospira interrogans]|uniref:Uncharacterized protein n=2 Tax=Leptospira interrogans TaxID=173 RepID=Q72VZ1_LEPIC|nr:hypothetical protein [Leptospira interrogans]APH40158.1 Uncharacterized protein A9P81_0188 [Leptospira interrogans serovar Copenhageni/Icterohaemorrhagiae]OCC28627.1 Uncharacterized protein GNX_2758 [Leptospira interrogans serovar Canicola]AAS68783.1 conserved hypothetical protein [Leptospira interrogans serovar Copenhageni str. Fiocruz L1-130]ARB96235.1 hypothetical protein A6J42_12650 [Leptospira interrogans serovar Copenhageni]KAA5552067.1 hypothetical protein F3G11_03920 [Leptospira int